MRLSFSTRDVAPVHRRDAIEAALATHVRGTIDFDPNSVPMVSIESRLFDIVNVTRIETSPLTIVTPSDDNGMLYLNLTLAGGGVIGAGAADRQVAAGDVSVLRRERRCTTRVVQPSRLFSIAIPRAQLMPRLSNHDAILSPEINNPAAARLLEHYAAVLMTQDELPQQEQAIYARHLIDLTVLMLGGTRDEAEQASRNGLRAARRQAVLADIAAHLTRPDLSVGWIARRQGISDAYVRSLFYDNGTSFTDHVRNERLSLARAMLTSPALAHHNVAAIALMAGFGDVSWFNTAFRRRYQQTPSQLRSTARCGATG